MLRFLSRHPMLKRAGCILLLGMLLLLAAAGVIHANTVSLPVLMYHHIAEEVPTDMTVSPARFEEQIAALTDDGWHAVSIQQLIDYVDKGTPLPDKPILITFDDGYSSNLKLAAPILERYGQHAVIFTIGINAGQETYPHTGAPLSPPRFALEDAQPWIEAGVVEVQSHTFDLHQMTSYGISGRDGVLPLPDESEADYRAALIADAQRQQALFTQHLGQDVTALAYPFGLCSESSEALLSELGIRVTFTTISGPNKVRRWFPSTLHQLCRYTITDRRSGESLLELLHETP